MIQSIASDEESLEEWWDCESGLEEVGSVVSCLKENHTRVDEEGWTDCEDGFDDSANDDWSNTPYNSQTTPRRWHVPRASYTKARLLSIIGTGLASKYGDTTITGGLAILGNIIQTHRHYRKVKVSGTTSLTEADKNQIVDEVAQAIEAFIFRERDSFIDIALKKVERPDTTNPSSTESGVGEQYIIGQDLDDYTPSPPESVFDGEPDSGVEADPDNHTEGTCMADMLAQGYVTIDSRRPDLDAFYAEFARAVAVRTDLSMHRQSSGLDPQAAQRLTDLFQHHKAAGTFSSGLVTGYQLRTVLKEILNLSNQGKVSKASRTQEYLDFASMRDLA